MKKIILVIQFVILFAMDMQLVVENQLIAKIDSGYQIENVKTSMTKLGFSLDEILVRKLNIYLIKISDNRYENLENALSELKKMQEVIYAQFDHKVNERLIPNDTNFSQMWDMHNEGGAGSVEDADIDAPEAWDITTGGLTTLGDEIVVAVVDGGVDINHEDLVDNIWVNENEIPGNGIDDDNNGYIDDINGWDAYSNDNSIPSNNHGTHVSGTIGAKGDNSTDVVGVNWDVKIMAVAGSTSSTSVVSIAYGYVLDQKTLYLQSEGEFGANVVATNSSFGIDYANCNSGSYPVWNDLYDSMGEVGILSAAATINGNQNVDNIGDVPTGCSSEFMVSVTNTTKMDEKYGNAGYGAETIDLGAPGTSICSTVNGNGVSCSYTGTSMATPHVAGAIGLLHSAASPDIAQQYKDDPAGTALLIRDAMFETVDILPSLETVTVSGGRLNIYNAVLALATEDESYTAGDVNNDGSINVQDIVILVNFVVIIDYPTSLEFEAGDLNFDGLLDVLDIVLLINIIISGNN